MANDEDHALKKIFQAPRDRLALSLSPPNDQPLPCPPPPPPPPLPLPPPPPPLPPLPQNPNPNLNEAQEEQQRAPHPWATNRRATVKSLEELSQEGIERVTGDMKCRRCRNIFSDAYDVVTEFSKLGSFIAERKDSFHGRSPEEWNKQALLDCKICGHEGCARPVIAAKNRDINWLFLLLGGFLSHCSVKRLRYFCKHTGNSLCRAKDRLLYLTYLGLCKQLDPTGPFDASVDY